MTDLVGALETATLTAVDVALFCALLLVLSLLSSIGVLAAAMAGRSRRDLPSRRPVAAAGPSAGKHQIEARTA
ncbi:MAG TPA: hypothetical protein VGF45_10335 [Polyangia bacterium]